MSVEAAYFRNLDDIERHWRELKAEEFPANQRDDLWRLCIQGQGLFWQYAQEMKRQGLSMVVTVPAYERAVMLLEHEERWKDAIRMCEEANKWGIKTDWYNKRLVRLRKKVGQEDSG